MRFTMADVLTPGQLRRLTEHKYSAEGVSLVEPTMQHFWRWLVEQIPLWWAPNALTLVGLIVNVLTTLILVFYSPDAKQEMPVLPLLLCALGLFIYQSLDAIDGKQARRTNSASALGELFDHGCDSVSTVLSSGGSGDEFYPDLFFAVFVILGVCVALRMGMYPGWLFLECFGSIVTFYVAHWQTYCTGTLKFGLLDVTEAQFLVITIYIVSAVIGPAFWETSIPIIGLEIRFIPVIMSLMGAFVACQSSFSIIFIHGGVGKSGSTVAGTSVLSPLLPMGTLITLSVMIWQKSPSQVYENHPVLYILSFGMAAAKITNKLVIAHMTKSEMDKLDSSLVGPGLLFFNQYFNTPFSEYFILWLCFFYCTFDLIKYSAELCIEICNYFDIYCFKIKPPTKSKTTNSNTLTNNGTSSHPSGRLQRYSAKVNK
ncbi:hypothetical protein LSH36_231g03016 [Paralvinella palmiformis]|uniref:Choline/ethanolaminephosphotransferase 1 n=1 Tax=Paralvinella palmiformis TaxID=53620 RepID=A0AAD9JM81_9ANNE|nr:hypothetical protein LSH36_231g03016 [Paralvinella palmiformis]